MATKLSVTTGGSVARRCQEFWSEEVLGWVSLTQTRMIYLAEGQSHHPRV